MLSFFNALVFLSCFVLCYACSTFIILLISLVWKISSALKDKGYDMHVLFFILTIFIFVLFAVLHYFSGFMLVILSCIVSLGISLYAGGDFSWYRVIK